MNLDYRYIIHIIYKQRVTITKNSINNIYEIEINIVCVCVVLGGYGL